MLVVGAAVAAAVVAAVEPPHTAAVEPGGGPHAFGYTQPAICTAARLVSAASAQPSPAATVAPENTGGGSVGTALVAVYAGSSAGSSPSTFEICGGGYCENEASAVAAIVPAPDPPVCHDWYEPLKGSFCAKPSDWHSPRASRGSVGIQPGGARVSGRARGER